MDVRGAFYCSVSAPDFRTDVLPQWELGLQGPVRDWFATCLRVSFCGLVATLPALATCHLLARAAGATVRAEETLRVLAHAWGASWVVLSVPVSGWLLAPFVLERSVREALLRFHGLPRRRATLVAVATPVPPIVLVALVAWLG